MKKVDGRLQAQGSRRAETDDLGEYRLGGLDAGSYLVALGGGGGMATRWALTFYPGTIARSQASIISVGTGEEQRGIDFAVSPADKHVVHVTGRVVDANGQPAAATIYLGGGGERPGGTASAASFRVDGSGEFAGGVEPGDSIAIAIGRDNAVAAATFTAIDGDVSGLTLALAKPGRMTGRVVFDGAGAPPPSQIEILAQQRTPYLVPQAGFAALGLTPARPRADGRVELPNLAGERILTFRALPAGWDVRSITLGSRDLLDVPFEVKAGEELAGVEIVLTRNATAIEGTAVDEAGSVVRDYEVLIVPRDPADRRARRRRWTRPDQTGRFSVHGLPPGEYFAVAIDRMEGTEGFGEWQDPALLDALMPGASRIVLSESQRLTLNLRSIVR